MIMDGIGTATGFTQEIPGGFVFEIGNASIHRRIHCISGRVGTTSLVNVVNGEEYLDETTSEFEITLSGDGQTAVLDFKDFNVEGYETPNWDDNLRTLRINLSAEVNDVRLDISLFYECGADEDFIRKWIEVHPCELDGWAVTNVTLENMRFKEMVEGVTPFSRYPRQSANREDDVHGEPDKADTSEPDKRFDYGDLARAVVTYWGYGEGLYFFTESLLGSEAFHRPTGLVMKHRDYVPLTQGLTTGPALIGAYSGPPEIGFKRYTEHLARRWCCIGDKSMPVAWSTWLVKLADYDRAALIDAIEHLRKAGFYDVLHLDLGWEADCPLKADAARFPNGLSEIARRAQESAGLDMSYWVNPFSCSYWKSGIESEHPEYLVPGKVSGRSGAAALCVMSDYYDYVKRRLVELVTDLNARQIIWDGNDWNIPECRARNHPHRRQDELEVNALKRLADICKAAHEAREDLIIAAFSLPFDNHRLRALDQEQISDTHAFPTGRAELIQRQQLYQMTWEHPFRAIRGSWYGVNWHEAGKDNLAARSFHELMHAEMSMIANGLAQSGGAIDFDQARPEFVEFLKKLFAFRKRFERYFNTYQHVLGFPDGEHIDGSGHIIDGSGFIVLVNPTDSPRSVTVPLDSPELELSTEKKYDLTDWSNLDRPFSIGSVHIKSAPEVELVGLEVKYIGVNV
ncbi:MAG: hypothetical protein M1133_15995 [Armatimonadetes bacterium]|nr:hypothetical protein [Armatimonadota bacterium]